jgi:hypothetical protein
MSRGLLLLTTLPIVIGLSAVDYNAELRAKDLSVQVLPIKELWQPPARISAQDLFHGPWSNGDAPDPAATYRFERSKRHGVNPGMTVVDPLGREWSVKQAPHDSRGAEGPIEVVLSRVLSAVGYHQPPVYYLPAFTLADTFGIRQEAGGRFRLKHPDLKERTTWAWGENPFVGMRPHQGLLVILVMFNSADLKNSNNSVYEHKTASGMEEWYVVRDLGAALGGTIGLRPRRGDPDQFASLPFLSGVNGGHVTFGSDGWRSKVVRDRITPEDVRWACALLAQLTERQWYDAFRAGGYEKPLAEQFIKTLRRKIAEGLALATA